MQIDHRHPAKGGHGHTEGCQRPAGRRWQAAEFLLGKATGRKHPGKDLPTKKCATFSPAGV
jgi:hypothetical protein